MTSLLGEKVKVCPPLLVRDFGPYMDPFYLYAYSYERLQVAQHRWASRNLSSVIISSFFLLNILNPADFSAARDEMACNELNEGSIDPSGGKTRRSDVPEDEGVEEPTLGLAFFSDRDTLLHQPCIALEVVGTASSLVAALVVGNFEVDTPVEASVVGQGGNRKEPEKNRKRKKFSQ